MTFRSLLPYAISSAPTIRQMSEGIPPKRGKVRRDVGECVVVGVGMANQLGKQWQIGYF